eukprot:3932191-Rhodomonas_salina.1
MVKEISRGGGGGGDKKTHAGTNGNQLTLAQSFLAGKQNASVSSVTLRLRYAISDTDSTSAAIRQRKRNRRGGSERLRTSC